MLKDRVAQESVEIVDLCAVYDVLRVEHIAQRVACNNTPQR